MDLEQGRAVVTQVLLYAVPWTVHQNDPQFGPTQVHKNDTNPETTESTTLKCAHPHYHWTMSDVETRRIDFARRDGLRQLRPRQRTNNEVLLTFETKVLFILNIHSHGPSSRQFMLNSPEHNIDIQDFGSNKTSPSHTRTYNLNIQHVIHRFTITTYMTCLLSPILSYTYYILLPNYSNSQYTFHTYTNIQHKRTHTHEYNTWSYGI